MKKILLPLFFIFIFCKTYSQTRISVTSPAYCSEIQGTTTINIKTPAGSCDEVTVTCWQQGSGFGTRSVVGVVALDENGEGNIDFPADDFPHGPITVKITGTLNIFPLTIPDECNLQLYNLGGVSWNEGLPAAPLAAAGMTLVYEDDFDEALSIGADPTQHRYYDHKPPDGWQDFSSIPFRDASNIGKPFTQTGTYMRIRADAQMNSTGLISSLFSDGRGFSAPMPSYWECRFIGPHVRGSWPAFWLMNKPYNFHAANEPVDELDVIEAYGNGTKDVYHVAAHAWNQSKEIQDIADEFYNSKGNGAVKMSDYGIPSTWSETFHTYGIKITETETIYYCDNIEVGRHQTLPMSKAKPMYFMINLATQGDRNIVKADMARYDYKMDMYVDYVRVYSSATAAINPPEESELDMSVYPNPVNSEAVISLNIPSSEYVSVSVFNTLGQQILSKKTRAQGKVEIPIDMSNAHNGIHIVKVNVGNQQASRTIIVEK